jgi:hypothetical protein
MARLDLQLIAPLVLLVLTGSASSIHAADLIINNFNAINEVAKWYHHWGVPSTNRFDPSNDATRQLGSGSLVITIERVNSGPSLGRTRRALTITTRATDGAALPNPSPLCHQ